jgi:hypothetical protein
MSSKSSPFASFADAARPEPQYPKYALHAKDEQLTVAELLHFLQKLVSRDPDAKEKLVFHVEFGSLTPSRTVTSDEVGVVISGGY